MDRRHSAPVILTLIFAVAAAALRAWSLRAAVDDRGLPVMHPSIYLLIAVSGVFLLLAAGLALRSPGRSGRFPAVAYGDGGRICGMTAAGLILLGTLAEFWEALVAGPTLSAPVLLLLGILGGICCFVAAEFRRKQKRSPAAELLPVIYVLIKTMLSFKSWSIDPIILDYCVKLFALIFTLLAFFRGAGFVLDQGKPRLTLFYAMAAVYFCAAAVMDGLAAGSVAAMTSCCGFLLWQIPVILALSRPSGPDPKPEADSRK